MKKIILSAATTAALAIALVVPAAAATADDLGGWDEATGAFGSAVVSGDALMAPLATVNHRGASEQKVINGTTNKRAHGWTTWAGVRHYTHARMEKSGGGTVYTSSGRQWGTSGTEAISPWRAFKPNQDLGSARTYYGR